MTLSDKVAFMETSKVIPIDMAKKAFDMWMNSFTYPLQEDRDILYAAFMMGIDAALIWAKLLPDRNDRPILTKEDKDDTSKV